MSKQYLTAHTVDNAHTSDIFALAPTFRTLLSAGGSSTIAAHDCSQATFPVKQTIPGAHLLGCHHLVASRDGLVAASVGFGDGIKLWGWDQATGEWTCTGLLSVKPSEAWALALSENGNMLAATTHNGGINVWDVKDPANQKIICTYETGSGNTGSFGMCVDISRDGKFTASGHQNGAIYVFNNSTQKTLYSLPGLSKPIRSVSFSPKGTRLAAAGDAGIIAMYDMHHGEQVSNLTGHNSWITSVDWSETGEWLLSSAYDGRVKVWSVERGQCVATHSETDGAVWSARWLPKTPATRGEMFAAAGANRSITFYREAAGI